MLCPEVWHFKEPASNFKIDSGSLDKEDCFGVADSICCNHLVRVYEVFEGARGRLFDLLGNSDRAGHFKGS